MPVVTASAVRKQIQSGATDPIYLLQGEDDVEKSALAHEFEGIVEEGLRAFNVESMHCTDVGTGDKLAGAVSSLLTAARTLPMMVPRRVVLVFQADALLVPKRESEAAARALEQIEELITHPEPQTTVVLVAGTLDRRGKMFKLLQKQVPIVECGAIESLADAERWVRNRVAAAGAQIDSAAARLLAERAGTNVKQLRNDVERLLLYALGQKTITLDDAREMAGSAGLQDHWAMSNAVEAGNTALALSQLALLLEAGVPQVMIVGQLRAVVPRLPSARIRAAADAVFRTDVDLKSSGGDARILLERLVVEMCAERERRRA